MIYDFTGWSISQLERYKQKKLEMVDRIGAEAGGNLDDKMEGAKEIDALEAEILQLEKEIAYKEKLEALTATKAS